MVLTSIDQRRRLLAGSRSIAMVGASLDPTRPSFGVFCYLHARASIDVVPINPGVGAVDGVRAYPTLAAYAADHGAPDIVNVFRRPSEAPHVARAAVAAGAKAIWFQVGILNDEAIRIAADAGLDVVADACIKVEFGRLDAGVSSRDAR